MSVENGLASGDPLALDGGIEIELERRGVPLRPHPGAAPLPVREPAAVRRVHLDAAIAGAAVVTASTGGLHRRALSRLGDSRRAREWSQAAIALARDAAVEATDRNCTGGLGRDGRQRPVRVAGLVLPLEGRALAGGSIDPAAASEHRANAAILAEGGVAIARIEGMGTVNEAEAAARAAAEEGLECWNGVVLAATGLASGGPRLLSGEPLEAWVSAVLPHRPAALLLSGATMADVRDAVRWCAEHVDIPVGADLAPDAEADSASRTAADVTPGQEAGEAARDRDASAAALGGEQGDDDAALGNDTALGEGQEAEHVDPTREPLSAAALRLSTAALRLMEDGASLVGPGPDGSPWRIRAIRRAADRFSRALAVTRAGSVDAWRAWLAEGTSRAGGGRGLWLAEGGPVVPLPGGFAWDAVAAHDLQRLASERYRLAAAILPGDDVADDDVADEIGELVRAVEAGGWLLLASPSGALPGALRADERVEWLAPTDARPPSGYVGWLGRRRQ
jgi:S-methylmethionine-dependent homocysteine/selenocysteine methylase